MIDTDLTICKKKGSAEGPSLERRGMVLAYCLGPAFVQNGSRQLGINEVGVLVQNIQRIEPGH